MGISANVKTFVILFLLGWTVSCQQPAGMVDIAEPSRSNFAVRIEVPRGTPGSMQYAEPIGTSTSIWFGEAQPFQLSYAGLSEDPHGQVVIAFEISHQEKLAFGNLTEANVGQHMAIEVDGEMICAPIVNSRLPGGGVIQGAGEDWDVDAANEIVYSLKTGGQKRESSKD